MSIDLGKAQVNQSFCDSLTSVGVKDCDAREIARVDAFGNTLARAWIAGLRETAAVINGGSSSIEWSILPDPWAEIGPALVNANGEGLNEALVTSIKNYGLAIQNAIVSAIGTLAAQLDEMATRPQPNDIGETPNAKQVTAINAIAQLLKPIDIELAKKIRAALERKAPKDQCRKRAGELMIDWLSQHGRFIRTVYGEKFYLYRETCKLYSLDTNLWHAWLYRLTSINPASTDFRYIAADCQTVAQDGDEMEVVRLAHWDSKYQTLRVSRFDGKVYRLDGITIEEESNGDGSVLFNDHIGWLPYAPDYSADGQVAHWAFNELPHWETASEECSLLLKAWWTATFFTELCPTRPILVLKGEKGSGKSMLLRILLRMVFGPSADVSGPPDKPDGFVAIASNAHVLVLDNLDELNRELRDKLARLSTGGVDHYRRLFTNNELGTVVYRCWLAITSRTPDTLQRDDLMDRTILLPVSRIEDNHRERESKVLAEAIQQRNQWWGDTLLTLNRFVAEVRKGGLPERSTLRMADWEAVGSIVARTLGQSDVWERAVKGAKANQGEALLEGNSVVAAIDAWLSSSQCTHTPIWTRDFYHQLTLALYGASRPDISWPKSVRSFGRQLAGMQRELQERLAKSGIQMRWGILDGSTYYEFIKASP